MRIILLAILIFAWTPKGINAQNTGNSTKKFVTPKKAIILPKKNNNYLLTRELEAHRPGRPTHFAVADTVKANINNSGDWSFLKTNKDLWTLEIESEGAHSLNLGFEKFYLPPETELFIYNKDKSIQLGPFTENDNDVHQQLWTPIIKGDKVIIELHIPPSKKEDLLLELSYVNHDFLGFANSLSGSCNLDVACSGEDGFEMVDRYRDIIRSVGAYHINGVSTCSGSLVNNTRQDKRGFFLSAEHCEVTTANAPSIVTYWNYENSFCRFPFSSQSGQAGNGNLNQFNTGAILRAKNANTDFCLFEFDDPVRPEYNPFYAGWDREFVSTPMAICVHHPGVEEKRISFELDEVIAGTDDFIVVTDWDVGTTEGGSSGAPLFTEDKKIIGQLEGGLAACSNNLSDSYGNFGASWFGSGTPSTSLRFWLDPDEINISSIDGFEGNFGLDITNNFQQFCSFVDTVVVDIIVQNSFTNFVNIEVVNIPAPLELISFEENITPGASTQLIFNNATGLDAGQYDIILISSDGTNSVQNEFTITVDDALPLTLTPLQPINGFQEASNEQLLKWTAIEDNRYHLQVSANQSFNSVFIDIKTLQVDSFNVENLLNETTYFWRVKAINNCGEGNWSQVFQFKTQITYCVIVGSENDPTEISASGTTEQNFNIFFDYPVIVDKVIVANVNLEHEYISDLDLELYNPETEESIVLLSQICDNQDDMNLGFSDVGVPNIPCPPRDGREYQPKDPLRNLKDINAQGEWELLVRDNFNFDGGTFHNWKLEICFSESEAITLIHLDENALACVGGQAQMSFYYNLMGETVNEIRVENAVGMEIPIQETVVPLNGNGELIITLQDNAVLSPGANELYLVLDDSVVETVFFVDLITIPEIELDLAFENGATIAELESIDWVANLADSYIVEISATEDFTELVWTSTQQAGIEGIPGPTLEDGDYYLRVVAINDCGSNSSILYNFSVDESVSILESTKKPLLVSQSLVRDEILISGNSDNAQISVAVISISGHKLLSQNTKEASLLLDVSALIPGVYLLELRSGKERTINKVVVY